MTCWTNCSTRAALAGVLLALPISVGCALASHAPGVPLEIVSFTSVDGGAPIAGTTKVRWVVSAVGGSSDLVYEFRIRHDGVETIEQEGWSPTWDWTPDRPGTYRVKATVRDDAGARVSSDWSSEIAVAPSMGKGIRIALLPIENLSGGTAPLQEIRKLLRLKLSSNGFSLIEMEVLEEFMKRYRVRNTGGLSSSVAKAIHEEIGADAFLVTSLEAYRISDDPMISVISRLVTSGERPEIVWMDGVGVSSEGYPGFLGMDIERNPAILLDRALHCLAGSLGNALWVPGDSPQDLPASTYRVCGPRAELADLSAETGAKKRHRPVTFFRSPSIDSDRKYRVALVPFLNLSGRKNAGDIVTLHFVKHLFRSVNFIPVDPGLVREHLLRYRIIMQAGPSIANAEILSSQGSLGVDLVFSGRVFDYQDTVGVPKVGFSASILDAASRHVVWSSTSHATGDDGVHFFDVGRIDTTHRLASEMVRGAYEALAR